MENAQFTEYQRALRNRVGAAVYHSWMWDLALAHEDENGVAVSTGSPVRRAALEQRYRPLMHDVWNEEVGPAKKFAITLRKAGLAAQAEAAERNLTPRSSAMDAAPAPSISPTPIVPPSGAFGGATGAGADKQRIRISDLASPLATGSTFQKFCVDHTNRIAHAAARQVFAESPNNGVIYFSGPSGVGKTHLLHAIGHQWRRRFGDGSCAYLTHSGLNFGCVEAVLSNTIFYLHKDLLSQQLLLIDDIHLLSGKRTQQEVLNMVNAFLESGRQLVVAGDDTPRALLKKGLLPRLVDRLSGGLAVPIEPSGAGLRREVLQLEVDQRAMRCRIDDEALEFISIAFERSMREALGALNQLVLIYGEKDTVVTRADAEASLASRLVKDDRPGTIDQAIEAAAKAFGIAVEDIRGRAQPQRIVRARHAVVYVAREYLNESFPRISVALNRDHTTAMSSYRRAQDLLKRDRDFREAVEKIRIAVNGRARAK